MTKLQLHSGHAGEGPATTAFGQLQLEGLRP